MGGDFECLNCGSPVDVEFVLRGKKVDSVRFPCYTCGAVGKGARVPHRVPHVNLSLEAPA